MKHPMIYRKKLIEVALPLEAINKASRAGEVDPARAPVHAAPVVGAAAAGGGAGGDLRADGGRSVGASGHVPDGEGAGEGAPAALPDHRGAGAVGEHDQRGRCLQRARDEIWRSWRAHLRRERGSPARDGTVRSGTSSPPSTIRSPVAARCRWRRSGLGWRATPAT